LKKQQNNIVGDWRQKLLVWYEANKRDLPWRNIQDPYKIWLSEIILQQTRVNQGWEYYLRFIKKYPDVRKLASAPEHDILKLWQGLGYYSRARNLLAAAHTIMKEHKGKFPGEYNSIRALKGVGDYTAGAIASIAFQLPFPAVDGNVMRVYSRLFGITAAIDSTGGKKKIYEVALELLPHKNPGTYNQAVMELGAMVCLPAKPRCVDCPVQEACYAFTHKKISDFPVKGGKIKQRKRYLDYLVIMQGNNILIRQRGAKDIWQGLYDFPAVESAKPVTPAKFLHDKKWEDIVYIARPLIKDVSEQYVHILSHQKLFARFYRIDAINKIAKIPNHCVWVKLKDLENYPVPKLIDQYIRKNLLK
jgi:A/G-specific adenine glycosylase